MTTRRGRRKESLDEDSWQLAWVCIPLRVDFRLLSMFLGSVLLALACHDLVEIIKIDDVLCLFSRSFFPSLLRFLYVMIVECTSISLHLSSVDFNLSGMHKAPASIVSSLWTAHR